MAAGVLLIALGVPILVASLNVVEYRVPYAFEGPFAELEPAQRQQLLWDSSAAGDDGVRHSVSILTDKDMNPPVGAGCWALCIWKQQLGAASLADFLPAGLALLLTSRHPWAPPDLMPSRSPAPPCPCFCNLNLNFGQIYVAFELGTYFQNFRRYVRSFDPARMHDGGNKSSPAAACSPFDYLGANSTLPINPCGQIAHSFFNDTFQLAIAGGPGGGAAVPLELDESNIAWASDREHLYGAVPAENYNPGGALAAQRGGNTSAALLNQNEHWMVSF